MTLERWWLLFLMAAIGPPPNPEQWSWTTGLGSIGVVACAGIAFWQMIKQAFEVGQ